MQNNIQIVDSYKNGKQYGGTMDKFGVSLDGDDYIVKFQKDGYISSVYSEYVASHFINALGFSAHETYLGSYSDTPVVILKDFTTDELKLQSFNATGQSSEDTDLKSHTGYSYPEIEYLIRKHTRMTDDERYLSLKSFWTAFLLDAILGNRDRHGGNWGFLTDKHKYTVSPMYDNGGSLFPDVSKVIIGYTFDKETFVKERSSFFPASLIKGEDGRRMNYFDAIVKLRVEDIFSDAFSEFTSRVCIESIFNALVILISECRDAMVKELYLDFYVHVIATRYFRMIHRCSVDDSFSKALKLVGDLHG